MAAQMNNLEVVERLYEFVFAGDFDSPQIFLADDFKLTEADGLPFAGTLHGPGALGHGFRTLLNYFSNLSVEKREVTAGGDHVMGLLHMSGIAKATGRSFSMPVIEVFRFESGKIAEVYPVYWDTSLISEITTPA